MTTEDSLLLIGLLMIAIPLTFIFLVWVCEVVTGWIVEKFFAGNWLGFLIFVYVMVAVVLMIIGLL